MMINYESCQNYFFLICTFLSTKMLRRHFFGYKVKFHTSFWAKFHAKQAHKGRHNRKSRRLIYFGRLIVGLGNTYFQVFLF